MMINDKEGDYDWERHGDPIVSAIANAAEIDEEPAADVQKIIRGGRHADFEMAKMGDECEFASDAHYEEKGPNDFELREEWRYFERSLKTETRFFNEHALATLRSLFDGLADHETRNGQRVVVQAGPGQKVSLLYRARVFQSSRPLEEALMRPDTGLGPPPFSAAVAGRMNALGISVFYGALDANVALAEIRPPVGSRVMVGKFELLRSVRLLDVEALKSVFVKGSIFDGGYIRQLERARFLGRLSERITRPVMPNDEPSDYLITQAIADYLATEAKLHGIIYASVQASGATRNVVLFHHAARVKEIDLPPNTELSASNWMDTSDGPEVDYWVWEEVSPPRKPSAEGDVGPPPGLVLLPDLPTSAESYDDREITLQLDLASLSVHHVTAVAFSTKEYDVRRHRSEKREAKVGPTDEDMPPI